VFILGWTLVAWGGRVGLLTSDDTWFDWLRIVGSVVIAVAVAVVLWLPASSKIVDISLYGFAAWTVALWSRSMVVNWSESGTLAFKLVHTGLALGFGVLVWRSISFARGDSISRPDQTHGDKQGESESTSVP
jgi:hypothetical protein